MRSALYKEVCQTVNDEAIWNFIEEDILSTTDPLQALLRSEQSKIITEKVEQLPPQCKRILKACLYDGKPYREIAQELNIQVSTVRVQMKKALDSLRKDLVAPLWILISVFL